MRDASDPSMFEEYMTAKNNFEMKEPPYKEATKIYNIIVEANEPIWEDYKNTKNYKQLYN